MSTFAYAGQARWGMFIAIGVLCLIVAACSAAGRDEVSRVVSPDGRFDAILVETSAGATTSFGYEVAIVQHGRQGASPAIARLYDARRNEQAYGANLRWRDARRLDVEYLSARSARQSAAQAAVDGERITVVLRPGVTDASAPAGGMAYNLGK